jgi:transcription initiation factor TFIIIB Brf1 subunit/transcription initiation factor TFIIB
MSAVERSLIIVYNKIERSCARFGVPSNVQLTTKCLFKRVYETNMEKHKTGIKREGLRGTKRDGLIAACMYTAFKMASLYWTKTRVAQVLGIDLAEIRRGLAIFNELIKNDNLPTEISKITGCKDYINFFAVGLNQSRHLATMCCKMYVQSFFFFIQKINLN